MRLDSRFCLWAVGEFDCMKVTANTFLLKLRWVAAAMIWFLAAGVRGGGLEFLGE